MNQPFLFVCHDLLRVVNDVSCFKDSPADFQPRPQYHPFSRSVTVVSSSGPANNDPGI